ncbi:MAG: tetratricopeptide repeat protein [Verrucomicrobiae bacterium]
MATPAPTDDTVIEHEALDASLFWYLHKKTILLGAAAVAILCGGSLAWYVSSTLSNRAAEAALATAKGIPAYEALASRYAGTMPAADALLLLASAERDAGKGEESTSTFQRFLKAYPSHPLAAGALLGIGQNQEASGNSQAAAATFQQVAEKYPASYAAPVARYHQGEILLREFRRDEARAVFEAIQTDFPESIVARIAAAQIARLATTK